VYDDFLLEGFYGRKIEGTDALELTFYISESEFVRLHPDSNPTLSAHLRVLLEARGLRYNYHHRYVYIPDGVAALFRAWATGVMVYYEDWSNPVGVVASVQLPKHEVASLKELSLRTAINSLGCDFVSNFSEGEKRLYVKNPMKMLCYYAFLHPEMSVFWESPEVRFLQECAISIGKELPYPQANVWAEPHPVAPVGEDLLSCVGWITAANIAAVVDQCPMAIPPGDSTWSRSQAPILETLLHNYPGFKLLSEFQIDYEPGDKCPECDEWNIFLVDDVHCVNLRNPDASAFHGVYTSGLLPDSESSHIHHVSEDTYNNFVDGKCLPVANCPGPYVVINVPVFAADCYDAAYFESFVKA